MDSLPTDKILKYNIDTLKIVRRTFGMDKPGDMKNAVDILEEWVKQQHHFTMKDFDRRYLETTIIVSKGSLERAKSKLDKSCTLRTKMPHLYVICDIKQFYAHDLKDVKQAVMPKMTKNHERVSILYNYGKEFNSSLLDSYLRTLPILCEYMRLNDYTVNNYLIIDYLDINLPELVKVFKISAVHEMASLSLDCCGFRLKALYILTSSKLIDIVISIVKQVLSKKLGERIYVLKDRESLHDFIDKEVLPKEYGGDEKSIYELHEEWINVLHSEDHIEYFKKIGTAKTDELSRPKNENFDADYMEMPGTFRSLNFD